MSTEKLPHMYAEFRRDFPVVADALDNLEDVTDTAGPLDERTVRLVKLGLAIGEGAEGAIRSNAKKALAAGASPEEVRQVAMLAIPTCGFPAAIAGIEWVDMALAEE